MADNLKSLLEGMGSTANEVAAFLEGQGIKGIKQASSKCPVSNYLKSTGFIEVWTGHRMVVVKQDASSPVWREATSLALNVFITAFDLGMYPNLESEHQL